MSHTPGFEKARKIIIISAIAVLLLLTAFYLARYASYTPPSQPDIMIEDALPVEDLPELEPVDAPAEVELPVETEPAFEDEDLPSALDQLGNQPREDEGGEPELPYVEEPDPYQVEGVESPNIDIDEPEVESPEDTDDSQFLDLGSDEEYEVDPFGVRIVK